jgi:hypothetical protein
MAEDSLLNVLVAKPVLCCFRRARGLGAWLQASGSRAAGPGHAQGARLSWQHLADGRQTAILGALSYKITAWHAEQVNVDVRVRGRDGRLYPARVASDAERLRVAGLVHTLRCMNRLSVRAVQEHLEAGHGVRRSVGAIAADLKRWRCEYCGAG